MTLALSNLPLAIKTRRTQANHQQIVDFYQTVACLKIKKKVLVKCLIICFRYFVVDGNFTEWGAWSKCSQTCENGTQVRFRSCTNPPPAFGGRDCIGPTNETRACNDGPCPGGLPVLSRFIVRPSFLLLGSFSINDGNGNDNAIN